MPTSITTQKITPCLWFDRNAEEAVNFYTSLFGNSRILETSRYGDGMPLPKGTILTVGFELEGQKFIALNGGPMYRFNEAVSFLVRCDTQDEIDRYWDRLTSDGGAPIQCGWLNDRFGLCWQIVPTIFFDLIKGPRGDRVMQAMMQMVKFDIAALKAAADGR